MVNPRRVARASWTPLLLGIFVCGGLPVVAQDDPVDELEQQTRHARIRQFVDGFMSREMPAMSIPGASISVVDGGKLVVAKGYGVADVDSGTLVDPAKTAFRLASVGKTFTALAVLQVAQSGEIELDTPVSKYLDHRFSIPPQVTARNLLLHTAGFDERLIGYQSRSAEDYPLLGDHLSSRLPAIHLNPDRLPSYSNYGYGLAGYVVESVTGTPLRDWVESKIFQPLGMDHSFYAVPPLDDRAELLATEYHSNGQRQPIHFSNPYPAGGVASSAEDMGRFLLATLSSYAGEASNVISPSVAKAMMTLQLQPIPKLEGLGFGLNQQRVAGQTIWLKGGAAPKHSALVAFLPEQRSAIFIALNRQEPRFWEFFLDGFVREFFPSADQSTTDIADQPPPRVAGVYEFTRTSQATIERIAAPLFQVRVRRSGSDSIVVESLSDDIPSGPFFHQEDEIFRDKNHYAAFTDREHGGFLMMNVDGEHFVFRTVPWYATRSFHLSIACVAALVVFSFPLVRWLPAVWRRNGIANRTPGEHRQLSLLCHFVSATFLAIVGTVVYAIADIRSNVFGATPALYAVSVATVIFTVVVLYLAAQCLRAAWTGGGKRAIGHHCAVAASGLALVVLFDSYNILWFDF